MGNGINAIDAAALAMSLFPFVNKPSGQAQLGIFFELRDQIREIGRPYRDVGIQITDKTEWSVQQKLGAGLQRHDLGAKTPSGRPGHAQKADESVLFRVT